MARLKSEALSGQSQRTNHTDFRSIFPYLDRDANWLFISSVTRSQSKLRMKLSSATFQGLLPGQRRMLGTGARRLLYFRAVFSRARERGWFFGVGNQRFKRSADDDIWRRGVVCEMRREAPVSPWCLRAPVFSLLPEHAGAGVATSLELVTIVQTRRFASRCSSEARFASGISWKRWEFRLIARLSISLTIRAHRGYFVAENYMERGDCAYFQRKLNQIQAFLR